MNRTDWTESDADCNVCGSAVEVGSATSRCSNRSCLTRDRDNNLGTDASAEEQADYWQQRAENAEDALEDGYSRAEIERRAQHAFRDYIDADSRSEAEDAEIRTDAYLDLLDHGWGWLKEESDV